MTLVVRRVSFLLLPAVIACLAGFASSQALEPDSFTCPMHQKVRRPKQGSCPHCGMDLVLAVPEEKPVKIAEGKLQEFCVAYVEDGLKRLEAKGGFSAYLTVRTWASLQGEEDARLRLRPLLAHSNLGCVGAAAAELGRLGDREAMPALKQLLASKRLRLKFSYHCNQHPGKGHSRRSECPICKRRMSVSIDSPLLEAHLSVAGAIHSMGGEIGFQALREILHDTYPATSETILGGLHKVKSPRAREALKTLVKRKDLHRWRRLTAAVILAEQGDSHYVDFILDALTRASKGRNPSVEIWALGEVGKRKHLFMLQRIIEQDPGDRADAVAAVLRILTRPERKK